MQYGRLLCGVFCQLHHLCAECVLFLHILSVFTFYLKVALSLNHSKVMHYPRNLFCAKHGL